MKRLFLSVCLLFFAASVLARIGGQSPLQGKITSLKKTDTLYLATVTLYASDSTAKKTSEKAKPGMSVKIIHSIGTSQFRMGIGSVLEIKDNGDLIVALNESLLDKEIADPNSDRKIKVRDILSVGADVSVSNEAL